VMQVRGRVFLNDEATLPFAAARLGRSRPGFRRFLEIPFFGVAAEWIRRVGRLGKGPGKFLLQRQDRDKEVAALPEAPECRRGREEQPGGVLRLERFLELVPG